jgi:hypothetical protein
MISEGGDLPTPPFGHPSEEGIFSLGCLVCCLIRNVNVVGVASLLTTR